MDRLELVDGSVMEVSFELEVPTTTGGPSTSTPNKPAAPQQVTPVATEESQNKETKETKKAKFECSYSSCRFTSVYKSSLTRHVIMSHDKPTQRCAICGIHFDTEDQKSTHNAKLHSQCFICDACGKTYSSRQGLKQHSLKHAPTSGRYNCNLCMKSFLNRYHFEGHVNSHHQYQPFKCSQCKSAFTYQSSLARHVESIHDGTSKYTCDICMTSFTSKTCLRDHMQGKHSASKFVCGVCGAMYEYRTGLAKHRAKKSH